LFGAPITEEEFDNWRSKYGCEELFERIRFTICGGFPLKSHEFFYEYTTNSETFKKSSITKRSNAKRTNNELQTQGRELCKKFQETINLRLLT